MSNIYSCKASGRHICGSDDYLCDWHHPDPPVPPAEPEIYKSQQDDSVNFVWPDGVEARYVRRHMDYYICYLSSQTGCNRGCQMCHLTATGQTSFDQVTADGYLQQAKRVHQHYLKRFNKWRKYHFSNGANIVHFNWMARGEPLCNPNLDYRLLMRFLDTFDMIQKHNISTIMPATFEGSLAERFRGIYPTIYYSLYSMEPEFRQKWLPGAMKPEKALYWLADYQHTSQKIIRLHWAFIKGQNDDPATLHSIAKAIRQQKLIVKFSCVRYNPPDETSQESPYYEECTNMLGGLLECPVKVIDRVGFDVKASCGMFISP